jgi:hypothetical protein
MDDVLMPFTLGVLTFSNSTGTLQAKAIIVAVQIASGVFIMSIVVINLSALVVIVADRLSLMNPDISIFNYIDIGSVAVAVVQGGRIRALLYAKLIFQVHGTVTLAARALGY